MCYNNIDMFRINFCVPVIKLYNPVKNSDDWNEFVGPDFDVMDD